jgi:putative phage abortive infection protein
LNNFVKFLALSFLLVGLGILLYFSGKAVMDGYSIGLDVETNYEVTGQFGDYVGGVVGTFFALTGTFLIFLTFQEQAKENKRTTFESSFFEMIRLHRENVSELRYKKFHSGEHENYENRQVMRIVFQEFVECYREIKKFSNSRNPDDYIAPKYLKHIRQVIDNNNPKISPIELARIDIAYCMILYGIGNEGEITLRNLFKNKYNPDYYFKLLYYMKLKPKRSNKKRFDNWEQARGLDLKKLRELIDELYRNRNHPEKTADLSTLAEDFKMHLSYEKYYGGHQFRLGHYFRHLYQSFKYLNNSSSLTEDQKYSYGKMYRAQLSTYEQALLLMNSISTIGMKWEFTPELSNDKKSRSLLITKYNLIKNLPGKHLSGIRYKTYYPNVIYETDEHTI